MQGLERAARRGARIWRRAFGLGRASFLLWFCIGAAMQRTYSGALVWGVLALAAGLLAGVVWPAVVRGGWFLTGFVGLVEAVCIPPAYIVALARTWIGWPMLGVVLTVPAVWFLLKLPWADGRQRPEVRVRWYVR